MPTVGSYLWRVTRKQIFALAMSEMGKSKSAAKRRAAKANGKRPKRKFKRRGKA